MGFLKRDEENEVSGGQVFGYILIGGIVLFIVAFGIFAAVNHFKGNTESNKEATTVEQTVDTTEE